MSSTDLPLAGLQIAVTRPEADAPALAELLVRAGAEPVIVPLTRVGPPRDSEPLRACAARIESYDWIVFTSANAVRAFTRVVDWKRANAARIAAVGSSTADAVRADAGRSPDLVPDEFTGDALAAALHRRLRTGARVLWPRAAAAGDSIAMKVAAAGALLDAPAAYATEADRDAASALARSIAAGAITAITFTAPSAVHALADTGCRLDGLVVACVGPTTASAAAERGFPVHVVPPDHTLHGLVTALSDFYAERP